MHFSDFIPPRWDFFGPVGQKNYFQDNAEDVSYEDVTEPSKKPVIDHEARAAQIAAAMSEQTSDIMTKSPIAGLLVGSMFVAGATWADEHPISEFKSRAEWISAQLKEVEKMQTVADSSARNDLMFSMILFGTFSKGADWADKHPAPTL